MLATVNGSNHDGIGVKEVAENLARIGKLEDALADFWDGAVDLIEEEETRVVATLVEPVRGTERRNIAICTWETNEVTLGHLGCATLDDGQTHLTGHLVDKLRFADAMATAKHERLLDRKDVGGNRSEGLEIDSHEYSIRTKG